MTLQKDLKEFIELLNSRGVEYVVVGAHALAYYSTPRYTGDFDILVRPSQVNARRIYQVICDFGFADTGLETNDFSLEDRVVQLGVPPNRIDILTSITGVTFEEIWREKVAVDVDSLTLNLISKEHLIKNKSALGRPKDLSDLDALKS